MVSKKKKDRLERELEVELAKRAFIEEVHRQFEILNRDLDKILEVIRAP